MARVALRKDALAGVMLAAMGITGVVLSIGYPVGTASRMGPGFVPLLIASVLAVLGTLIAAVGLLKGSVTAGDRSVKRASSYRPLVCILTGLLAFGATIKPAGLIIASLALLGIGSQAVKGQRLADLAALFFVLIAAAGLVFVYAIGVQINLLPVTPVLRWN